MMTKIISDKCENSIKKKISKSIISFESIGCSTYSDVYNLISSNKENIYVKITGNGVRFTYHENVFYMMLNKKKWILINNNVKQFIITHQEDIKNEFINNETVEKQEDEPVEKQENKKNIFSLDFWKTYFKW